MNSTHSTKHAGSKFSRAVLLSVFAASCGCAHTLENLPKPRGLFAAKTTSPQLYNPAAQTASNHSSSGRVTPTQVAATSAAAAALARPAHISDTRPGKAAATAGQVRPVSYDEPLPGHVDSTIVDTTDPACVAPAPCASDTTCNTCAPQMPCGPMLEPVPQYWNDQEYLYDGGDRAPKVEVTENWRVHGLDSQDTIAHYETIEGKLCVSPSNRVPIYAPRFGAVRKTTAPTLQAGAVGARGMTDPRGPGIKASNEPVGDLALPQGPKLRDAIAPIDSLRDRTRGVAAEKILPPVNLGSYQMALGRLQSFGPALRREDLLAILGEYMVNARTWTNPEGLSVAISGVTAVQVRDTKQVEDITLYETEPANVHYEYAKQPHIQRPVQVILSVSQSALKILVANLLEIS